MAGGSYKKGDYKNFIIIVLIILVIGLTSALFKFYTNIPSNKEALELLKKDKSTESTVSAGIRSLRQANEELKIENYDSAIESFTEAIEKQPDNYFPYMMLGWVYYQKAYFFNDFGLYEDAISNFENAIELNPNNFHSYNGLGWVYTRFGNYDLALKNFDRASRLNPLDDISINGKSFIFKQIGLLNKSIEFSLEAIRLNPTETDYYDVLGWTYHEMGKIEESKEQFSKSLSINPNNHIALNGMGWDLDHEDKFEEAIPFLEKSIQILPNFQNYEGLARSHYGKGNYTRAIEAVFKELQLLSNNSLAWRAAHPYSILGWSHYRLRDYENAIRYFNDYLRTNEDLRVRLGLISAFYLSGKVVEANKVLEGVEGHESGIDPHHLDHHSQRLQRYTAFLNCIEGKELTPQIISGCIESNPAYGI